MKDAILLELATRWERDSLFNADKIVFQPPSLPESEVLDFFRKQVIQWQTDYRTLESNYHEARQTLSVLDNRIEDDDHVIERFRQSELSLIEQIKDAEKELAECRIQSELTASVIAMSMQPTIADVIRSAENRMRHQTARKCADLADSLFKFEDGFHHYKADVGDKIREQYGIEA